MKLINCLCFCDALNNIAFDMKGKLVEQKCVKSKLFTSNAPDITLRTEQYSHVFCLKIHMNVVTNSCNAGSIQKYSTERLLHCKKG